MNRPKHDITSHRFLDSDLLELPKTRFFNQSVDTYLNQLFDNFKIELAKLDTRRGTLEKVFLQLANCKIFGQIVDGKNSFGAEIRTNFRVELRFSSEEIWARRARKILLYNHG